MATVLIIMWVSGFKYMIFLGNGFLRYGLLSCRLATLIVAILFLRLKSANETINFSFFKPAHLGKISYTRS